MIIEKDFKIEIKEDHYVLYFIKSKNELKEDKTDQFKIGGYFIYLGFALNAVYRFRKSKNYPGKENPEDIIEYIKQFKEFEDKLHHIANYIYEPIYNLQKVLNEKS